jgi:hypothetical protein
LPILPKRDLVPFPILPDLEEQVGEIFAQFDVDKRVLGQLEVADVQQRNHVGGEIVDQEIACRLGVSQQILEEPVVRIREFGHRYGAFVSIW